MQDRLQKNLDKLLYMVSRDTIASVCLVRNLTGLFQLSEERSNQPLCLLRPWFPSLLIMLTRVPIIVNHHGIFTNMNTNSTDSFLIWSPVFVILDLIQVCISDWQKKCSTYHYQVLQSSNLLSHSEFIDHFFWYCSYFPSSISFFSTIEDLWKENILIWFAAFITSVVWQWNSLNQFTCDVDILVWWFRHTVLLKQ